MVEIEGVIEDVVFRNEQNGWTVLNLKSGREHLTCVGELPPVVTGERFRFSGEWAEHREYGRQLKIAAYESIRPTTAHGIERYLASGIVRGIGPATAKLIVHAFGEDALNVLDDRPDRLMEIAGIGPKRAQMIAESYAKGREARQTLVFLQTYGISPHLAAKVVKAFGERTLAVVREDPYLLAEKVEGIGFKTADAIASALGIELESEHRLSCGVKFALTDAVTSSGHMYLPRDVLLSRAGALLGVKEELLARSLCVMLLSGELVLRGADAIYLRRHYDAEGDVARMLTALNAKVPPPFKGDAGARVRAFEQQHAVSLEEKQRAAVLGAVENSLTVLTGGPGTGKTTCLHAMLALLREMGETLLCAPTGRAAKRMSEAANADAQTIHRLLEYNGETESFARDEENPLACDAVIVDEMSMVDIFLMRSLLRALPEGCRLVLVGDQDQLPSVGAGNVLGDVIESGAVPLTRLTEIFRQAEESAIVSNAHRINRGEMPLWNKKNSDFFFERAETSEQAAAIARALVRDRLPGYLNVDAREGIQVMSPMKKGDAGVSQLNRLLQSSLNPPSFSKSEISLNAGVFREGDKVMQMRNNYELEWSREGEQGVGAFNGDIGFIERIDPEARLIAVRFDDGRVAEYGEDDSDDLDMAYAMTVHKSQGSEFEAVVILLVSGPPMLYTRNLLYTAVTRAKRLVVLVGRESAVRQMVNNNYISKRYTALAQRLRENGAARANP